MVSVGVIVPSWQYYANPFQPQPLNELYFATVIDSRFKVGDVKAHVIDLREARLPESNVDITKVAASIPEHDVFLYWIAKTADFNEVASVACQLREAYPQSKQAAGGTHVDNFPDQCKKHFDAIVRGPGEESFVSIINDIQSNSLKREYFGDWRTSHYDNYPFARRDYLPERSIVNTELFKEYEGVPGTSAMFSRGCNFKCAYCAYNVPKTIQMRSTKSIEKEVRYLKGTYKIGGLNLRDEICIPLSKRYSIPFIEIMGSIGLIWRGQTRIGPDKEVLAMARESGCVELALGVESASQEVLKIIRKGQTLNQVRETSAACHEVGIKVKMCLILGLPGEPRNIVELTRSFIEETRPEYVSVSGFCPVPGSDIFVNSEYYGIKYIDKDWSKHAHLMFRYSDDESHGVPFEYEGATRWGKAFSRHEIMHNITELQQYLRDRGMSY